MEWTGLQKETAAKIAEPKSNQGVRMRLPAPEIGCSGTFEMPSVSNAKSSGATDIPLAQQQIGALQRQLQTLDHTDLSDPQV